MATLPTTGDDLDLINFAMGEQPGGRKEGIGFSDKSIKRSRRVNRVYFFWKIYDRGVCFL